MHTALLLCVSCLLLPAATLADLSEQQEGAWERAPSLKFRGSRLRSYISGANRMVEPYVALQIPKGGLDVRPDPLGQGHYLSVPLVVDTGVKLPGGSTRKWHLLKVYGFRVSLRKSIRGSCAKTCPQVSVSGRWRGGRRPSITFRCHHRSACHGLSRALRFKGPDHEALLSALHFTFHSRGNHVGFRISRAGLPVVNAVTRPFRNAFWFEGDKLILYTVKANSGHMAYEAYQKEQSYAAPRDGSLPALYRSGLVDQLAKVTKSGQWQIVAEMRKAGRVVAQAVFSADPKGMNKNSWFSPKRLLSTRPYWFGRSNYNVFSIAGDLRSTLRRRFAIYRYYGGCNMETSLFFIADMHSPCGYVNKGGKAPFLIYNPNDGTANQKAAGHADQFLIYLRPKRPVPPPFATKQSALIGAYEFEANKVLLFTVKAHSGHQAVDSFLHRQPRYNRAPRSHKLPNLYRSDLIDNLSQAVIDSGKQYMVAEMRVGNRVVSQVVFDTSVNRQSLNKNSWFHQSRVVYSYPYRAVRDLTQADAFFHNPKVRDTRFHFFSVVGDRGYRRGFFIAFRYNGCEGDQIFWDVADNREHCPWGYKGWRGKAPLLVYSERAGVPMQSQAKYADRFLIYLK